MNPYSPPQLSTPRPKRRRALTGIVIGGLLTLSPIVGMLGTVFSMRKSFDTLGESGIGDPAALSGHIGESLIQTAISLMLCPIGLVVLIISLVSYYKRPKLAENPNCSDT